MFTRSEVTVLTNKPTNTHASKQTVLKKSDALRYAMTLGNDRFLNTARTLHNFVNSTDSQMLVSANMCKSAWSSYTLLSPVMTITWMPASRHSFTASTTSALGGSSMPTIPTNVQFVYNIVNKQSQSTASKPNTAKQERTVYHSLHYRWVDISKISIHRFDIDIRLVAKFQIFTLGVTEC